MRRNAATDLRWIEYLPFYYGEQVYLTGSPIFLHLWCFEKYAKKLCIFQNTMVKRVLAALLVLCHVEGNGKATNDALHQKAVDLANQLDQYGVHADFRNSDGTWWITEDKLNPSNVGKLLHSCYHTGGFVGQKPLKPDEQYIKAENGELVLTSDQQDGLAAQIDRIGVMTEKLMSTPLSMAQPILPDFTNMGNSSHTINNVVNRTSQPMTINQGDVIIQGAVMSPQQLASNINPYIHVTRQMANELANRVLQRGGWARSNSYDAELDHSKWK